MGIAAFPMYDWPELRRAHDDWWAGLAGCLRRAGLDGVPDRLTRGRSLEEIWGADDLLVSQTCGYPFVTQWRSRLRLVATPAYGVDGFADGRYCSLVLVRADSGAGGLEGLRGAVAAINGRDSLSGYWMLKAVFAPFAQDGRFFSRALVTGSHAASIEAVARGRADLCAVDCVAAAIARRHRPALMAELREIARSSHAPGLPFVTGAEGGDDRVARLCDGLREAMARPDLKAACAALFLTGVVRFAETAYEEAVAGLAHGGGMLDL